MISGKPVRSEIERTRIPSSISARAVPPVEMTSIPSSVRPWANSTIPVLSETDSSARLTCTSSDAVTGTLIGCALASMAPIYRWMTTRRGLAGVQPHRAAGDEPHGLDEQLVLDRVQLLQHRVGVGGVGQLEGPLEDDRTGVDPAVDEEHA